MSEFVIKGSNLTIREKRLANPEPILRRIGAMMTSRAKNTFLEQGRETIRWAHRGTPNVAGIVKDAEMGRTRIPERRFQRRPAGIDTRFTARSISNQLIAKDTVQIGTTSKAAGPLQKGGPRRITVTTQARSNLIPLIAKAKERIKEGRGTARDTGLVSVSWLLYRSSFTINPPARPFLFFTKQDRHDCGDMIRMYIQKPDAPPGTGVRL